MNKKILLALVLGISVGIFYSFGNENKVLVSPVSVLDTANTFLTGAMHDGMDYNYSRSPEIGLNVWHKYTAPNGWGWIDFNGNFISNDNYLTPTSEYADAIRQRLDSNNNRNMFTLMDRPKFEYLAYGQRSDYQCESLAVNSPYWFYAYTRHDVGEDVSDSGQMVRYCTTNDGQGWIVKDLISNREQANYKWNQWMNDDYYKWFAMPRIRINPGDTLTNKKVCRVDIIGWDGDRVDSIVINSKNFSISGNPYSGQYLEMYFSRLGFEINQEFGPGKTLNPLDSIFVNYAHCHIDFRVWFYNECEMWIDRIRVENEPAHRLLTLNDTLVTKMIPEEVNLIALPELNSGNPSPFKYYVEEFEFNTVPCMSYINKKVDSLTNHRMSFMVNLNYELFNAHIPDYGANLFSSDEIKTYFIDRMEAKEIFMGSYALEGWLQDDPLGGTERESYSPNTLPIYNTYTGDYERFQGILSYKTSPGAYDDWLQDHFDNYNTGWLGNKYTYLMRMAESISKTSNIPFYNLMQAHLIWNPGHKLKEPSNEELKLTANLAVSYGAKGIMYFGYNSEKTFSDTGYQRGLVEPITMTPRISSVYGQNKWEGVRKIDSTLRKWGPYIMSFDNANRSTYILRLERDDLISETFFKDVLSYKPVESEFPAHEINPETVSQRYLQIAKFNNPNEQFTRYFMIVNRRCSPIVIADPFGVNGRRSVTIQLDSASTQFSGFNNWSIYDLERDSLIKTFNKNVKSTIDLGWYLPGQGKLYKIAPVMQEGGTLVTNEDCSGSFDCKGEVNNNGYDINIRPGTTIVFTNASARIIMTEGDFKSGILPTDNTASVYLKGKDGNFWKGLQFQNCPSVEIVRTYFENISPYELDSTYAADIINCGFVNINYCSFRSELDINAGGVRANFTTDDGLDIEAYILNNYFKMDAGDIPALSVITSGYITFPV